jgi:membrane protein DedA with SNARE-associated domain
VKIVYDVKALPDRVFDLSPMTHAISSTMRPPAHLLLMALASLEAWPRYISQYGYVALFVLAVVEGPIVTIIASFLASQGVLSLPAVYATVVLGDLAGDGIYYAIGRGFVGRLPWHASRWGKRVQESVDHIGVRLRAQPGRALLFGKLTHSAGFAVLLAAGAAQVRLGPFFLYNLLGTLPKSAVLVVVGYFFGRSYNAINDRMERIGLMAFVLLAGVIVFIVHRWAASRGGSKDVE